ncbi:S24/S26 family peptidase [Cohnella faecalis]|uniref:Signal peptidase I n=1 Tax=Cohnella faecalis TaxID=2315694 RepID=A0A398CQ74_9BACL|nr:S24/S26 family peptidase [Cohnella faecalis]RIE04360.1 hypothetical protein D3H35_07125 [Cohnella faecalis]
MSDLLRADDIRQLIRSRGSLELPAHGKSMYPYLKEGQVCRFVPPSRLRVGEVILFVSRQGQLVGHRYHRELSPGCSPSILCKGDSNRNWDEPISPEQIVGRLAAVRNDNARVRRADSFVSFLWGRLIVAIPSLSFVIRLGMNIKKPR